MVHRNIRHFHDPKRRKQGLRVSMSNWIRLPLDGTDRKDDIGRRETDRVTTLSVM